MPLNEFLRCMIVELLKPSGCKHAYTLVSNTYSENFERETNIGRR